MTRSLFRILSLVIAQYERVASDSEPLGTTVIEGHRTDKPPRESQIPCFPRAMGLAPEMASDKEPCCGEFSERTRAPH
jgi:hypothetical protein